MGRGFLIMARLTFLFALAKILGLTNTSWFVVFFPLMVMVLVILIPIFVLIFLIVKAKIQNALKR